MKTAMKDKVKVIQVLDPDTVTATGATTGVDTADFGSVMFVVNVGAFATFTGSNKLSLTVQDSEVDTDGSYANCVDADIYDAEDGANGIAKVLDATDDDDAVHVIHYRGNKRYVRLNIVEAGTVSVILGVTAVCGNPELMPPL